MGLRLRRGTDTQRQSVTFAEGELIYVTDYVTAGVSPLWIGDGSTAGGNEVETGGTPSLELNDLTDVNAIAVENNVLVYKGSQWTAVDPSTLGIGGSGVIEGQEYNISINGSVIGIDSSIIVDHVTQVVTANLFVGSGAGLTDINLVDLDDVFAFGAVENDVLTYNGTGWVPLPSQGIQLGQTYNINIEGDVLGSDSSIIVNASTGVITGDLIGNVTGNVVGNLSGDVIGNVTGDLNGSVYTDNSTLVIDGIYGDIYPRQIKTDTFLRIVSDTPNQVGFVQMETQDEFTSLSLIRKSNNDLTGLNNRYGQIRFGRDDASGLVLTTIMSANEDFVWLFNGSDGVISEAKVLTNANGDIGIGTVSPVEKLDVRGNVVTTGFVQFGSLTTTERNALTPAAGMVIWNSTTTQFEGFDGTNWINLIDGATSA